MALRVCFALGSVVDPWFWLGCSVFVCVCVYVFVWFFVCCGSLFLFVIYIYTYICVCVCLEFEKKVNSSSLARGPWCLNKFGLGGVLSTRLESAPGSKIQDALETFLSILDLGSRGAFKAL